MRFLKGPDVPLCLGAAHRPSADGVLPTLASGTEPVACLSLSCNGHWLTIAEVEREHIRQTLERTFYNQCETARLLGIERHQLARKIRKYGLDISCGKPARPSAKAA